LIFACKHVSEKSTQPILMKLEIQGYGTSKIRWSTFGADWADQTKMAAIW